MQKRITALLFCALFCAIGSAAQSGSHSRLPDFRFKLLDGAVVNSTDLKGKVVVVEFWGTWR